MMAFFLFKKKLHLLIQFWGFRGENLWTNEAEQNETHNRGRQEIREERREH